ncbi:MAG: RHS repeat-associated core domain-containing protein [Candidatus Coproplasma sp.]
MKQIIKSGKQGNVNAILDGTGTVVVEYRYDAWDNHTVSGTNTTLGNLNPFRYRGYFYDTETGLYYLKTRYYDPVTGRFLNMDSIDYADHETICGLNLYAYCYNNPVMNVDPNIGEGISIGILSGITMANISAGFGFAAATAKNIDRG